MSFQIRSQIDQLRLFFFFQITNRNIGLLFNYVFNSDSTFTNALKKKTLKGTFSVNPDEKTVELKYALGGKLKVTTLTAHVVISGDELSLLFNADKLLDFLTKLSSISDNSTLKLVNKLASEYDGMMLGFELKK